MLLARVTYYWSMFLSLRPRWLASLRIARVEWSDAMIKFALGLAFGLWALGTQLAAQNADAWEENFRRCEVRKQFPQGTVIIEAGEQIELEIQWNDRVDADEVAAADI